MYHQLQKRRSDSGGVDGEGERVVASELQRRLDTAPPVRIPMDWDRFIC